MFKIYDGRTEFFQWDLDEKLIVEDSTITQVHFSNKTDTLALVCEVYEFEGLRVANVPNILLQNSWDMKVYAYKDNHTVTKERFKVRARTKPADYVYTETEVLSYETLEKRVEALEVGGTGGSIKVEQEYKPESPYAVSGAALAPELNKKLCYWQRGALYRVGDYVIRTGNDATYIYSCNFEHVADEFFPDYWDSETSIEAYHSEYADKALRDYNGNVITEHYATKKELGDVAAQLSSGLKREIVTTLPSASQADENTIYMVSAEEAQPNNLFEEYLVINGAFELIGSTAVDLTDYVTKDYFNDSLGDIENALNEIIQLQISIIGG